MKNTFIFFVCLSLAGCAANNTSWPSMASQPTTNDEHQPTASQEVSQDKNPPAQSFILPGTSDFLAPPKKSRYAASIDGDGISLNFVNAPINNISKAILGDVLGLNYAIDPDIKGTISLQSFNPVAKANLMALFEETLKLNNLALINSKGLYSIVPLPDAQSRLHPLQQLPGKNLLSIGYGTWAVPLRFVSAAEMQKILEPFKATSNILSIDQARNLLIITGTTPDLNILLNTIRTFDVSWLKGMTLGMFIVKHIDAEQMVTELGLVFQETPLADLIQLTPINRLNMIMAWSPQPAYIDEIEIWIDRLDQRDDEDAVSVNIYEVQYGKATDLVDVLSQVHNSQNGGSNRRSTGDGKVPPDNTTQSRPPSDNPSQDSEETNTLMLVADENNNSILIKGTQVEYETVLHTLAQLDQMPLQVLIEATIVEVSLNDELEYGVEWFFRNIDDADLENPVAKHSIDFGQTGFPAQYFPGFSYAFKKNDLNVILNALASVTDVKVLSSPQLLVINNETATLQVGDQVPVATQSAINVADANAPIVNSIEHKDTGVILEITPRINKSGLVYLEINQEVSDVTATISSGIDSPTIQQRKINTTVVIENNETVALGGLIRENTSKGNSGVPFLKDIPLLGIPFRSTTNKVRRLELIMFVTPHIIHNGHDARAASEYLQQLFEIEKPFKAWQNRSKDNIENDD